MLSHTAPDPIANRTTTLTVPEGSQMTRTGKLPGRTFRNTAALRSLTGICLCLPIAACAWGPFGPETCATGYVWRGACGPNDHACVTPTVSSLAAADISAAASRRAGGGAFGP